jgi:hypothetical protein
MSNFDHILNWKLLSGSHDFPGPDGGTCINEAAIIAAGFEYKSVQSVNDCPPCFSNPLSTYLIGLNDRMPDDERQRLMRFVTRLSGSADTPEVEQQRAELIALRTIQRILPPVLIKAGLLDHAKACAEAPDLKTAAQAAAATKAKAKFAAEAARAAAAAEWMAEAAEWAAAAEAAAWAAEAAARVAEAATWVASWVAMEANIWSIAIEIAEEAFAIGNQATTTDTALVIERLDKIRQVETA